MYIVKLPSGFWRNGSTVHSFVGPCKACNVRTAAPQQGASGCTNCEVGKYSDVTGLVVCKICSAGTFSNDIGAQSIRLAQQVAMKSMMLSKVSGLVLPLSANTKASMSLICCRYPAKLIKCIL